MNRRKRKEREKSARERETTMSKRLKKKSKRGSAEVCSVKGKEIGEEWININRKHDEDQPKLQKRKRRKITTLKENGEKRNTGKC